MASIRVRGLEELQAKLKKGVSMDLVKQTVKKHGNQLEKRMIKQTETSFKKGYSKGDTAGTINCSIVDDGLTAKVGPKTEYAEYVEYGTRFMEAEPFIKPALDEQKELFKNDLKKLMK